MTTDWVLLASAFFIVGAMTVTVGIYGAFLLIDRRTSKSETLPASSPRRAITNKERA